MQYYIVNSFSCSSKVWGELHSFQWYSSNAKLAKNLSNQLGMWVVYHTSWYQNSCWDHLWWRAVRHSWQLSPVWERLPGNLQWTHQPRPQVWTLLWIHQTRRGEDDRKFSKGGIPRRTNSQSKSSRIEVYFSISTVWRYIEHSKWIIPDSQLASYLPC